MRYTRNMDFKEFRALIWPGIQLAVILILCIAIIGGSIGLDNSLTESAKENFYLALKGNKTVDAKMIETANIAKEIKNGEFQNWNTSRWENIYLSLQGENILYGKAKNTKIVIQKIHDNSFNEWDNLGDLIGDSDRSIGSPYYALKNWPATTAYLENSDKEIIKDDFKKWFLPLFSWLAVTLTLLLTASSYIYYNYSANNGWWRYPWRKWWAYPIAFSIMIFYTIVVQVPLLILAIAIEIIITKKHKGGYSEAAEQAISSMKNTEENIQQIKKEAKVNKIKIPKGIFSSLNRCLTATKKALRNSQDLKAAEFAQEAAEYLPQARNLVNELLFQNRVGKINAQSDIHRKRFKNIGRVIIQDEKKKLEEETTDMTSKLSNLGREIMSLQQILAEKNLRLDQIRNIIQLDKSQDLSEDFDKIRGLSEVEAVEVDLKNDAVIVYTKKVNILGHLFGNYEISLCLKSGGYAIRNLTKVSLATDRDHIHGSDGSFCFGDMTEGIKKFIRQKQCYAAIYYILIGLQDSKRQDKKILAEWPKVS